MVKLFPLQERCVSVAGSGGREVKFNEHRSSICPGVQLQTRVRAISMVVFFNKREEWSLFGTGNTQHGVLRCASLFHSALSSLNPKFHSRQTLSYRIPIVVGGSWWTCVDIL